MQSHNTLFLGRVAKSCKHNISVTIVVFFFLLGYSAEFTSAFAEVLKSAK